MNRSTIVFLCVSAAILGALLGLGAVEPEPVEAPTPRAAPGEGTELAYRLLEPGELEIPRASSGATKPVTVGENVTTAQGPLREDRFEITIPPGEWVEYKAVMDQGAALVYTWRATGGNLFYDFHADVPNTKGFFTRYRKGEDRQDSGSILAPFTGLHGWYWENEGSEPAVIELEVAGFYTEIKTTGKQVAAAR